MPTLHVEAQVSPDDLLQAVDQLGMADLERFVSRVLALRARRAAPSASPEETALLGAINRGLPPELGARLSELQGRSEEEALSVEEHGELLALVAKVQALEVERLANLTRLAGLRGVSLAELMDRLGIRPPDDG